MKVVKLGDVPTTANFSKLEWVNAHEVQRPDGKFIQVSAFLPEGPTAGPFWNIYREKKDEMKADGMVYHKNPDGRWRVIYVHKATITAYKKKEGSKMPNWVVKMRRVCRKYSNS